MALIFLPPTPSFLLVVSTLRLSGMPDLLPLMSTLLLFATLTPPPSMVLIFLSPTVPLMGLTLPPLGVRTLLPPLIKCLLSLTALISLPSIVPIYLLPTLPLVAPCLLPLTILASIPTMVPIFPQLSPRHQAKQLPPLFHTLLLLTVNHFPLWSILTLLSCILHPHPTRLLLEL